MFRKVLIANRGEIACRIVATARRLGIATVAVHSDADARARHIALADEAWPVGPAPPRESYLSIETILDVARRSGADCIHPGYGFLSENAEFAEACASAGIIFIGPPASAIRAMGSKAAAKALMARAGVPLVPGYHGAAQDGATLEREAARIGYPVLIKASAGGGGKGMRIVEHEGDFQAALDGARREAASSFGDDTVLVERYLVRPRHIEVQIFADMHGNIVHLFERDCSIQRRYQKVIEEAPAQGMTEDRRRVMGEMACNAARAVGYVGAGTVEFIVAGGDFHFMEMNTRLQVEHPVTEMITGQDLVAWQFRVAAGEPLPLSQPQIRIHGHAIEARVYAEDPERGFLPSTGTLIHLRQPRETADIRVDTGVRQGDAITPHYDPMIAKLIVWGSDRREAVRRLSTALAQYEVVGVRTNLSMLRAIAAHAAFASAEIDTGFIAGHADALATPCADTITALAAAASAVLADTAAALTAPAGDPYSPWADADAWRMNGQGYQDLLLHDGKATTALRAHPLGGGAYRLDLPRATITIEAREDENGLALRIDGVLRRSRVVRCGNAYVVILDGRNHEFELVDPLAPPRTEDSGADRVTAPIPARVSRILVDAGDQVTKGTPLLVLEAMKMELTLSAPMDGTIEEIRCRVDEMVAEGVELVTFGARAEP